jgi:hypothetical protein
VTVSPPSIPELLRGGSAYGVEPVNPIFQRQSPFPSEILCPAMSCFRAISLLGDPASTCDPASPCDPSVQHAQQHDMIQRNNGGTVRDNKQPNNQTTINQLIKTVKKKSFPLFLQLGDDAKVLDSFQLPILPASGNSTDFLCKSSIGSIRSTPYPLPPPGTSSCRRSPPLSLPSPLPPSPPPSPPPSS